MPDTPFFLRCHKQKLIPTLKADPTDLKLMAKIQKTKELLWSVPIEIVLWEIQNDYYVLAKTICRDYLARERAGEAGTAIWLEAFRKLGEIMRIKRCCLPRVRVMGQYKPSWLRLISLLDDVCFKFGAPHVLDLFLGALILSIAIIALVATYRLI